MNKGCLRNSQGGRQRSRALGNLHLSRDMRSRKSHCAPLRRKECCQLVVRCKMAVTIKPVWISQTVIGTEKTCFQNG